MGQFTESVEQFLTNEVWTTSPEHAPAVASLRAMAVALDKELVPAMMSQFGLTFRSLLKAKPPEVVEDPLEKLLTDEGGV